ncbi:MAG: hypothetical protein CRN43_15075 [Candidatus Nephrothrix sp. EaCA]|nr:MAG: hypothetical protein CRN43_15075 [Candidatus Nephrothrix sp. EaCA]
MKKHLFFFGLSAALMCGLASCLLNGNQENLPPESGTPTLLAMTRIDVKNHKSDFNTGLQYFVASALTFPPTNKRDTVTFSVTVQGPVLSRDITVTLKVDESVLRAYYSKDAIDYQLMPPSNYAFVNQTGVIKAGSRFAEFQIIFFPDKFDLNKSLMCAVTASNDAGVSISSNFGHIYFHTIANPVAGVYKWDWIRYNNAGGTGNPASTSFTGRSAVFSPLNPTEVTVKMGYYTQPNYIISFKDTHGTLSDFKVKIDPKALQGWLADKVEVTSGPTLTVSPDLRKFTIKFAVSSSSGARNLTDVYYK